MSTEASGARGPTTQQRIENWNAQMRSLGLPKEPSLWQRFLAGVADFFTRSHYDFSSKLRARSLISQAVYCSEEDPHKSYFCFHEAMRCLSSMHSHHSTTARNLQSLAMRGAEIELEMIAGNLPKKSLEKSYFLALNASPEEAPTKTLEFFRQLREEMVERGNMSKSGWKIFQESYPWLKEYQHDLSILEKNLSQQTSLEAKALHWFCTYYGIGCHRDTDLALDGLEDEIKQQDNMYAQYHYAIVGKNRQSKYMRSWLEKAANAGCAEAALQIIQCYADRSMQMEDDVFFTHDLEVEDFDNKMRFVKSKWCIHAAYLGHPTALSYLGSYSLLSDFLFIARKETNPEKKRWLCDYVLKSDAIDELKDEARQILDTLPPKEQSQ